MVPQLLLYRLPCWDKVTTTISVAGVLHTDRGWAPAKLCAWKSWSVFTNTPQKTHLQAFHLEKEHKALQLCPPGRSETLWSLVAWRALSQEEDWKDGVASAGP